jgi:type IV secretion system protein TrbL
MRFPQRLATCGLVFAAASLVFPDDGLAQAARCTIEGNNTLDCILDTFQASTRSWQSRLAGFAQSLFWILAAIEFTWAAIQLAFRGADLSEWLSSLVNQVLFIGFFAALLQFSAEWAGAVVASFQQAANSATGTQLIRPSDIFDVGVRLATALYDASSNWNIVHNLVLVVAGFFILLSFGLIAASLIVALVESYIVISAGVLFMGFGGSRWTKDYAVRTFQYCVSVGAKLFVIQLLAGLTVAIVEPWASVATGASTLSSASLTSVFVLVGISVVFVAITRIIPEMVQSLINGTSTATGGGLYGTAAGLATTAVAGAVGGAMASRQAGKLASEQLATADADGTAPRTTLGRVIFVEGNTVSNFGKHAVADVGNRLGGRMGQWSGAMERQRQAMRAAREKRGEVEQATRPGSRGDTQRSGGRDTPKPDGEGGRS